MDRTELLNYLISQRNATRYLEIGVHAQQQNFNHIRCAQKEMVSPATGQDFFERETQPFDVIFIDGIHEEDRVLEDIRNATRSLARDGVIVLHDCMPPDAWHQRPQLEYTEGESWNGTVWKAALRTFNASPHRCLLLDMDWGCGLIDTAQQQTPRLRDLPADLDYSSHYSLLMDYTISIADYIRTQVKLFYHLACMGNWSLVLREQLRDFQKNGFLSLELSILGADSDRRAALAEFDKAGIHPHIVFQAAEMTHFEKPALLAIEDYARRHEGYVLYTHSKGVSNPGDLTKVKWRRLMMKELVSQWERCMHLLPQNDLVGVNWRHMPPFSHFCGNFWYASTRYLRKLADFNQYYDNTGHHIGDSINSQRLGCEFWISSAGETPVLASLCCSNVDFCNGQYWTNR